MRTLVSAIILLGVIAVGAMPAAGGENQTAGEETAVQRLLKYKVCEKDLAKAVKLLKKRQVAAAEASLLKCLQVVPAHYEAHFLLAGAAAERGDLPGAITHMELAETELKHMAGLCRSWQEENAHAETAERELVSGEAQDTMVKSPCAANSTKIDTGRLDRERGIAAGPRLAPLDPRRFAVPAGWHFAHGNYLYKLRRWNEAAARYRLAIEGDPQFTAAWNNLLSALLLAQRGEEARGELQRALQAGAVLNPELRQAIESTTTR